MVKNYLEILHFIKNTGKDHTMKQLFDISEKLKCPNNQMRSMEWIQLFGRVLHETFIFDWWVMKKSSVSRTRRFTYFQILYCALERWITTQTSNSAWEEKLSWFKSSSQYRTLDTIDGEPMEFKKKNFPGFTTLQFCNKVQEFMLPNHEKCEIIFTREVVILAFGSHHS